MEFSYATTTSESDWSGWTTRNVDVADGGITLARTTAIRESDLGASYVDLAVDPSGLLYTLRSSGALYRYNPSTDTRQRLLDATDTSLESPRAVCASENRIFVADGATESIVTVSPRLQRETGTLRAQAVDPVELTYDSGTIYVLDGDERIVCMGDDDLTIDWWLRSPVDIAVTDELSYALDTVDGEPTVRAFRDEQEIRDETFPLSADAFTVNDTRFVPTAVAAPRGSVVLAGTMAQDDHGLFEWNPETREFEQLATLADRCVQLVSRPAGPTPGRVFYALVGDNRTCYALREVTEYARHAERDRHVGLAVHRYDSGADDIEWHRLALELARSSASTQVRVRYHATDDRTLFPLDSDGEKTQVVGLSALETEQTDATTGGGTAQARESGQEWDPFDADALEALATAGVDSVWELATADPDRLTAQSGLAGETVRRSQRTAIDVLAAHIETAWTHVDEIDPEDILLRSATGRYLYVAIELVGTPTVAPLIDSMTAYCPRQSYLRYLPELYQSDTRSSAFLERYLSVFETSFADIESEIERLGRYLDPHGAPSQSLAWLEDWLAADEYRHWPESARREFLARAPELYKKRGTKAGLRAILELYLRHATGSRDGVTQSPTGRETSIDDDRGGQGDIGTGHRLFFVDPSDVGRLDDPAAQEYASMLSGDRAFALFCGPFESNDHQAAVEHIVETEKPAHVDAHVLALEDELTLGGSTFLGLNSSLQTRTFAMGDAVLGEDTILGTRGSD
ncbi:phage tail protein [Natronolimnobius sp. AArcel1]|uniref:phage tail protein n=1 Tax=Natronolimnobius sp. AArcel1 TaxID=1679093 RepID=UPI0013ECD035|nr:phage tail protein [Natronolimnobius sp. AArcel1]NGM68016.1 phage tail protein [Natronolimnobius sp. AArcel1]